MAPFWRTIWEPVRTKSPSVPLLPLFPLLPLLESVAALAGRTVHFSACPARVLKNPRTYAESGSVCTVLLAVKHLSPAVFDLRMTVSPYRRWEGGGGGRVEEGGDGRGREGVVPLVSSWIRRVSEGEPVPLPKRWARWDLGGKREEREEREWDCEDSEDCEDCEDCEGGLLQG